jgi:sulfite reductase beta subunit-like hemoprotein
MTRLLAEEGPRLAADLDRYVRGFSEAPPPPPGGGAAIGDQAFARWRRSNTLAQRQAGYLAVTVKLPLGDITVAQLHALAEASRRFGNGEARATNTQNFVLRWVPEGRLLGLHRALEAAGLAEADADRITDVVACPGGDYCSLAITRSMKLGADIRAHLVAGGAAAEEVVEAVGPFAIKISGCPNSCGQHHIGDVGLTGLMVKGADGVERPHYSIRVGGAVGPNARIGDRLDGRVPEEEAPRVIAALAQHYVADRGEGETFREFAARVGTAELQRVGLSAANGVI